MVQYDGEAPARRVLVIEDDPGVRKMLGFALADVSVGFAGTEEEAVAELPQGYDTVLLDGSVPARPGEPLPRHVGDGFAAARRVIEHMRAMQLLSKVKIVGIAGSDQMGREQLGLTDEDQCDYTNLGKPFALNALYGALNLE